jgi:hypothetical protein
MSSNSGTQVYPIGIRKKAIYCSSFPFLKQVQDMDEKTHVVCSMKRLRILLLRDQKQQKSFGDYGKFATNLPFKLKSFKWEAERFFTLDT